MTAGHDTQRGRIENEIVRPLIAGCAVAVILHQGGANWWLASAGGYSLLNVLWTIWSARG